MAYEQAAIAANRFGLGARPGDLDAIGADPVDWLLSQLDSCPVPPEIAALPGSVSAERELGEIQKAARAAKQSSDQQREQDAQDRITQFFSESYVAHTQARYAYAVSTDEPFTERLVYFWTNHFAVSADKRPQPALAATLENEAVRPRIDGRFADLLIGVIQHPAMILYLDNEASAGPYSPVSQSRRGRDHFSGLNENLAREILELHTLGVDGGYSQEDVTTFASVLTGWSVAGPADDRAGQFVFRPAMHEPGAMHVLGRRYAQRGVQMGIAVLEDVAMHPSTARHLATKIARHFVADEPPAALVERLAKTYLDNEGELAPVYRALVSAPESWAEPFAKYKTPDDYVISAYRAFGAGPEELENIVSTLESLGQRPFTPGSPAGWPDTAEDWDGGDALVTRIEWGATAARRFGGQADPTALAESLFGGLVSDRTRSCLARAESTEQGLTLLLASPEFQRR